SAKAPNSPKATSPPSTKTRGLWGPQAGQQAGLPHPSQLHLRFSLGLKRTLRHPLRSPNHRRQKSQQNSHRNNGRRRIQSRRRSHQQHGGKQERHLRVHRYFQQRMSQSPQTFGVAAFAARLARHTHPLARNSSKGAD